MTIGINARHLDLIFASPPGAATGGGAVTGAGIGVGTGSTLSTSGAGLSSFNAGAGLTFSGDDGTGAGVNSVLGDSANILFSSDRSSLTIPAEWPGEQDISSEGATMNSY
jgi:hypothetical protein